MLRVDAEARVRPVVVHDCVADDDLAHAALLAWVVLGVVLFRRYPGPRVVAALYVFGILFLPELRTAAFVPGVPEPLALPGFKLTKVNAIGARATRP